MRLAREIDADLIALSTRGHSGLKHLLLGSTAERVVRNAPCPVLVVRKRKKKSKTASESLAIRTILIPVDFSTCSLAGTHYAAFLAKRLNSTLRLFHVTYPYVEYVFVDRAGVRLSGLMEAVQEEARQEMDALKQMDFLSGVRVQTEIRAGHATEEICKAAGQPDIDLIVTSTHGRTGLKHALIGSVAEHVVRYAECPVMVVPQSFSGRILICVCKIAMWTSRFAQKMNYFWQAKVSSGLLAAPIFGANEFYRGRSRERRPNVSEPERISYEKEKAAEKRDPERAKIASVQTERTKTTGRGRRRGAPEHSRI